MLQHGAVFLRQHFTSHAVVHSIFLFDIDRRQEGGHLVATGTPRELAGNDASVTGRYVFGTHAGRGPG